MWRAAKVAIARGGRGRTGQADEEGIGPLAREGCEGRIDLAACAGVEDLDLQPDGARSRFARPSVISAIGTLAGLTSKATRTTRAQLAQESEPLCVQLGVEKIDAGHVAARPGEAGDKTKLDRVIADGETIGIVDVAALAASAAGLPGVAITATRRRTSQPPVSAADLSAFRPAVFDRHVLAFDIASFAQAFAKRAHRSR